MKTYKLLNVAALAGVLLLAACKDKNTVPEKTVNKSDSAVVNKRDGLSIYQLDGKWVTQNNKTITLSDLKGKVQVIAMIFTHCRYACPKIVDDIQEIEAQIPVNMKGKVGYTLVTFDVDRDSVGQLKAFAKDEGLDSNWRLLRGDEEEVRELSMLLDVNYEKLENGDFNHTSVITILDENGVKIHRHEGLEMDAKEMANRVVAAVK